MTPMKATLLCILLALAVSSLASDFYLSPTGSDSNSCLMASPCKTINGIQTKLTAGSGKTVFVTDGIYVLSTSDGSGPIKPTVSGGSTSAPISYQAASGAKPVFTGAQKLTTTWSSGSTGCGAAPPSTCYTTTIPAGFSNFDYILYVPSGKTLADVALTNARRTQSTSVVIPTGTYQRNYGPALHSVDGCTLYDTMNGHCTDRVIVNTADIPNLSYDVRDIKYYNFGYWNVDLLRICSPASTCVVANYGGDSTKTELLFTPGQANASSEFLAGGRYMIVNSREYFRHNGTPGTFYLDCGGTTACVDTVGGVGGATLYYIAKSGETPGTDTVYIPQLPQLVTAKDVNYLKFKGLYFVGDNVVTPSNGYTANTGQPTIPAAVSFVDTNGITVDSSVISHTAGWDWSLRIRPAVWYRVALHPARSIP